MLKAYLTGLRTTPKWQRSLLILIGTYLVLYLCWYCLGYWVPYLQAHPLIREKLNDGPWIVSPLNVQKSALWMPLITGQLLFIPVGLLIHGWVLWKVTRVLTKNTDLNYDHGMAAIVTARLLAIPFDCIIWILVLLFLGACTPPIDPSMGIKPLLVARQIPHSIFMLMHGLIAINHICIAWLVAGYTLGSTNWKKIIVAILNI